MHKTLTVLKHELKQTLKRRSFILVTLSIPLLLVLGYGIYQGVQHWTKPSEPEERTIGYVDHVGTFDDYTSQGLVSFVSYGSDEEAKGALLADEVEEYVVIPGDYLSTGLIHRFTQKSEIQVPGTTQRAIEDFLLSNLLADDLSPELLERAKAPMYLDTVQLDESGEVTAEESEFNKYFLPIIFGMLFVFAIFFSSGFLLQSVSEEKENRVIEILLSSVSSRQLLAGKVLGLGTAGLMQTTIWLVSVKVFADVASVNIPVLSDLSITPGFIAVGLVYFVLGYLLFAALFAGIGSLGSTARESQSLSGILVMPAVMPLWTNYFIINNPDGTFAKVLTFVPFTASTTAMMRLSRDSMSSLETALSLLLLAASVVLALWMASKVFRAFLLMYGKSPSLKEIVRSLRAA
jgi:ABC-2 type transport system permease protein